MPAHLVHREEGRSLALRAEREMASRYLAAIRSVQPHGPYRLVGYSAGGLIAYAMAEQLIEEGETLAFLGLIDASATCPTPPKPSER